MQDLRKVGPRSPKEFRIIACIEGNKKILLQDLIPNDHCLLLSRKSTKTRDVYKVHRYLFDYPSFSFSSTTYINSSSSAQPASVFLVSSSIHNTIINE
ncbi:unnamed protein product [Lactuca virosa]|uniref:Uncharacterized protein n=1 Tax=Lactuca virosa TaxID=75947 RepID=A0AAU9MF54_9ASTR|nr:unnamed protein product [Lactuca virosa]